MSGRVISMSLYKITVLNDLVNSQEKTCGGEKQQFLLKTNSTWVVFKEVSKKFKKVTNSFGWLIYSIITEAATRGVLWKNVFLEISQNSQENTYARVSFLIKLPALRSARLLKNRLWHRCFPVNFAKFSGTTFCKTSLVKCYYHNSFL